MTGALQYIGAWNTTSATDFSALNSYRPIKKGWMFRCSGNGCVIDSVDYKAGDIIIFNRDIATSTTITSVAIDKYDHTQSEDTVLLAAVQTLTNKTINGKEITSVTLSQGVEEVGEYAFYECNALKKIELPSSLTRIEDYAFFRCNNLSAVVSKIQTPFDINENVFASSWSSSEDGVTTWPKSSATLYVPDGTSSAYQAIAGWNMFAEIVEGELKEATVDGLNYSYVEGKGTATVTGRANEELRNITIPGSVTIDGSNYSVKSVAPSAFRSCDIDTLIISSGVETIGKNAFNYCWNLKKVELPSTITSIGEYAFVGCTKLNSITLSNSLKELGRAIFQECSNLNSVEIPSGVETLGDNLFSECSGLASVIIPNTVEEIGASAFYGCTELKTITIPNSVLSINNYAFWGSGLTSVTIPSSVTTIKSASFRECLNLSTIDIPNSVVSIGGQAFYGCSNLSTVNVGNGISTISSLAFANCTKLTDFVCHTIGTPIATNAFKDSNINNATLHVPSASVDLYRAANVWKDFKSIVAIEQNAQKCEAPTINYSNGELTFSCATDGVEYVTEIAAADAKKYYDNKITLSGTYNVSVYATKDGYESSDVVKTQIVLGKTSDSQGGGSEEGQHSNTDDTSIEGDLTGDGKVNAEDVVKLVGLVMKQEAGSDTPSTPNTPADDSDVTSKISASYLNSAAINVNGVFLNGSQFGWYFINESSVTVQLISAVLIDAATGVAGSNVLTEPVDVAAGEKKFQATAVTGSGITQPKVKFTYKYNNKEYSVEATMPLN